MRKAILAATMLAGIGAAHAFEVMPVKPLGGAYNGRTDQTLADVKYLKDSKAGICTKRLRQSVGTEGFPVHEAITRDAYQAAYDRPLESPSWLSPLIAGVIWNDDPHYLMRKAVFNGGLRKLGEFKRIIEEEDTTTLTGRSHFGDLQFLHAMAPKVDGRVLSSEETRAAIRAWLQASYEVSTGRIAHDAVLATTPLAAFDRGQCPGGAGGTCRVIDLFDPARFWREEDEPLSQVTRQLALGAMLHTVQDSFSRSHVQRDESRPGWPVVRYYSYPNALHCVHDMVLEANRDAIEKAAVYSRRIAVLSVRNAPWSDVAPVVDEMLAAAVPAAGTHVTTEEGQ